MPTEARKQPCVIWGRHKGPLAEESLAHQDWAKFTEDGEWMPPSPNWCQSPELPRRHLLAQWRLRSKCFSLSLRTTSLCSKATACPTLAASPSHWSKGCVCCPSWWHQLCSAPGEAWVAPRNCSGQSRFDALCIDTSMSSASLLQMGALRLLRTMVSCQLWWIPLLSMTSQFSIKLRFKCMSKFTCLESSSHQELLTSGFTAGWTAFNLRLISYL